MGIGGAAWTERIHGRGDGEKRPAGDGDDASDLKSCRNGTVQAYAYVYATRDACTRKKTTTESLGAGFVNAKPCHTSTPLALLALAQ